MPLFYTAYDTTACTGYVLNRLEACLATALISGALHHDGNARMVEVRGGDAHADAVPEFAHPFAFEHGDGKWLAIDVRPFGSIDRITRTFAVRNVLEYSLLLQRSRLNDLWIHEDPALLRDVSPVAMSLFASWISENVARRFALDPREQLNLAILAAFHYLSLFTEADVLDNTLRLKLATQVSRGLRASAEDVLAILEGVDAPCRSIADFCAEAEKATRSVRLQAFSPGILISIIKGTWFGVNAQEMLAVALEHPPTWLSILVAAHIERSYRNSGLARLVERYAHKEPNKQFVRAVQNLAILAST